MVADGGHDLGVAFDGDADRAFFIDERAEAVSGSTVTALIATLDPRAAPGGLDHPQPDHIAGGPGDDAGPHGGTPIRTRVGH